MSRTRIVGGNITKITGGKYKIFAKDNIEFHSNKQVMQNAKDGIFCGEPEKPTERKTDYLIKGEWKDDKNNVITKAKVGTHVKFCIETKDIPPNTPVKVELKEFDGNIYIPLMGLGYTEVRPFDDDIPLFITNTETKETTRFTHVNVNSAGKVEFGVSLDNKLDDLIGKDAGTHIELYFKCTYEGHEMVWLPKSEDSYLEVRYSDRTLYLQSAAENSQYGLPEFRTADGDILIFSGNVEKVGDSAFPQEEEEKGFGDRVEEKVKEHIEEKIDEKKEETIKNLLERRSVRGYKEDLVPEEVLNEILEAGEYAPSGMGQQGTLMVVTQNPELVAKLSKMNADVMGTESDPFYGAPTVVVVFADSNMPTCVENGSLVMGNLMNAAHALGVDSCWIHRAREVFASEEGKALKAEWGVPESYVGIGHCVLGYRSGEYPKAKARKDGFVIRV